MSGTIRLRFVAGYLLLGAVIAFFAAASVLAVFDHGSKASKSSVSAANARTAALAQKLAATRSGAVKAACMEVSQTASQQGIIMTACNLAPGKNTYKVTGDVGTVAVLATDGNVDYLLRVTLNKGTWVAGALQVEGSRKHKASK